MSDDVVSTDKQPQEISSSKHPRQHLWHAAFWAGVKYGDVVVEGLQQGHRVWFSELAPLTVEERVLVMGALCKRLFQNVTDENQGAMYAHLVMMYGPLKGKSNKKGQAYAH
jgi:hypothetical protein